MIEPAPENIEESWTDGTEVLKITCTECNDRIGEVRATSVGLLLGMSYQMDKGLTRTETEVGAWVYESVFRVADEDPHSRANCRCGHDWRTFPYDQLKDHLKKNHKVMPL